jgi:hypothetical protein
MRSHLVFSPRDDVVGASDRGGRGDDKEMDERKHHVLIGIENLPGSGAILRATASAAYMLPQYAPQRAATGLRA